MTTIITDVCGLRINTAINVEDILIEPTDDYLAAHMPDVRTLFRLFYEAFVEKGSVTEDGELFVYHKDRIHDAVHCMGRFMQGKPPWPTREEFEEGLRRCSTSWRSASPSNVAPEPDGRGNRR